MAAQIIDGKAIAAEVRAEVANDVKKLQASHGLTPGLAVVLVGEDPASKVYVKNKAAQTVECGMQSFEYKLPADTSEYDVLALVHRLSQQRGLTVIAVLHDINMAARYCDYLVALRGGECIAQGTPDELMRGETLEQIYGIPMGILPHPGGAAPVSFVY